MIIFSWVTALLALFGVVLNIQRDHRCFYIWLVTNASWVVVDTYYGVYAQAVLHVVYVGLSIWGVVRWRT